MAKVDRRGPPPGPAGALEETTKVALSGLPALQRAVQAVLGLCPAAFETLAQPARPTSALPDPARAPPECGLPNKSWNSRLRSDKEGPRQIDAAGKPNPSLAYVRVWGHRDAC